MNAPSVSVVVPTRNRAALLPDLLDALDRQDYPSYEVIAVDDASTDATPQILSAWAGEGRQVIRMEQQSGSYAARNAGWRAASAEMIAFTDDDCLPASGWLSALMDQPEMVGVQGKTLAETGEITPFTHQIDQRRPGPPYRTCNIAYRRSVLERLGGFDESFRWYADNIFGLRARQIGPIAFAAGAIVRHPPRPRVWRDVATWEARFEADARHRAELRRLAIEPIIPPRSLLPLILWVLRPLAKQSLFHLRYLVRHPRDYLRGIGPMAREKRALLEAMRRYYRHAEPSVAAILPVLSAQPLVSVVVVTRDRPELLTGALAALRRQTWKRREIIVVDHAGNLAIDTLDITVVRAPGTSLGAARQRGLEVARGDVVAFTDDDCIPDPAWLGALIEALRQNHTWRGVQGRTVAEHGPIGSHAIRVMRTNTLYQTCNIAYRREALLEVGGFDVDFQGWFEDTALAARVLQSGPIGFAADAVVVHRAVPRRRLGQSGWRTLLHDERLLAQRYEEFYRRTRGPGAGITVIARWLLGSPLKILARDLPRASGNLRAYRALARSLLRDRIDLGRVLLEMRRKSAS